MLHGERRDRARPIANGKKNPAARPGSSAPFPLVSLFLVGVLARARAGRSGGALVMPGRVSRLAGLRVFCGIAGLVSGRIAGLSRLGILCGIAGLMTGRL